MFNDGQGGFNKPDRPVVGEPVEYALSTAPRPDEARMLQYREVARDNRAFLGEVGGNFADASLAAAQKRDNLQPDRVPQRRHNPVGAWSAGRVHMCANIHGLVRVSTSAEHARPARYGYLSPRRSRA